MLKKILQKIAPKSIRRNTKRKRKYKKPNTEEVFEEIYRQGTWGKNRRGLSTSGSGSHTKSIVAPYIKAVRKIGNKYSLKTAVDLGCGDFAVGSKIYDIFDRYTACDISSTIIERNRKLYKAPSLEFRKLDLSREDLPPADVAFVRQVLQHLSNKDIMAFVKQVNKKKPFRYLVVTEHLPFDSDFTPNIDQPSGPSIRVGINSGVVLHKAPFSLKHKALRDICVVEEIDRSPLAQASMVGVAGEGCSNAQGVKAVIKSTLYVL